MTETRWDWFPAALRAAGAADDGGEAASFVEAPLVTGGWVPAGSDGGAEFGWLAALTEVFAVRGPAFGEAADPSGVLADVLAEVLGASAPVDGLDPSFGDHADGPALTDPFDVVVSAGDVGDAGDGESLESWHAFEELVPDAEPVDDDSSGAEVVSFVQVVDVVEIVEIVEVDRLAHDDDPLLASFDAIVSADDLHADPDLGATVDDLPSGGDDDPDVDP